MELNEKLYELRKKNNWSQEELAEKMEVSRQTISKWESGKTIPELNKLVKLSEIYKITLDELVKESVAEENTSNVKSKCLKINKKILIILLIILLLIIILFDCNIIRRMRIIYDISSKYKNAFQCIGENKSGHVQEKITKRDINNIEETKKEYLYYVSENGEKLLKIISYEVNDDEFSNNAIEEIYIDLNKEIKDTLRHYSDVTKINLKDGTREIINDYEFNSPIIKATGCMNNYYSIICAYDNLYSNTNREIAFDFHNKLFKKDEAYGWTNTSIKGMLQSISMTFNNTEFYMNFDYCKEDIKEQREVVSIIISNELKPKREDVLVPEI